MGLLVLCMLGLVLIEQFARNTRQDLRWRTRYLNIGLGMFLSFNLVHHAIAVLSNQAHSVLYPLQPLIYALLAPMVMVASLRNRQNQLRFSLSRNFAFQTGVLVTVGILLTSLALFSYIAQVLAGDIGLAIGVFSLVVGTTFTLVIFGSQRIRRRLRVLISKTFFEYRYDYREEWMEVTSRLTEPDADFSLAQQAQRVVMDILQTQQSCLWRVGEGGQLTPMAHIQAADWYLPIASENAQPIRAFYQKYDWVLETNSLPKKAVAIEACFAQNPFLSDVHYVVPLIIEQRLFGVMMLGKASVPLTLGWEDYDIIKLAAKQSAGFLAFQHAAAALSEKEQLSAMNQVSAFLIHDLKTITSQLGLMLENASKHRQNPAFIDDMLDTTKNSVSRMQHIIAALRQPDAEPQDPCNTTIDLVQLANELLVPYDELGMRLTLTTPETTLLVSGVRERIQSALQHILQNAVDAAASIDDGYVTIDVSEQQGWAVVSIQDNGRGMTKMFIDSELFSPFKTRKGITGMGVGAYQARSIIHEFGGDLEVKSEPDKGSEFIVRLPISQAEVISHV